MPIHQNPAPREVVGACAVCAVEFYDETSYRQYVTGERHHHRSAVSAECG